MRQRTTLQLPTLLPRPPQRRRQRRLLPPVTLRAARPCLVTVVAELTAKVISPLNFHGSGCMGYRSVHGSAAGCLMTLRTWCSHPFACFSSSHTLSSHQDQISRSSGLLSSWFVGKCNFSVVIRFNLPDGGFRGLFSPTFPVCSLSFVLFLAHITSLGSSLSHVFLRKMSVNIF